MRPSGRALALVLVLTLAAMACEPAPGPIATLVLFDVSASTRSEDVRARYVRTFDLVLDALAREGGVLGVDVIDANPIAHGSLPINERFEPCTVLDNSLECDREAEGRREQVGSAAARILQHESVGTDIFGALSLAEDYFEAYPEAPTRRLVVLSDMVQRSRGLRFPSVGDWSETAVRDLLDAAPSTALDGVEVYVIGVGGTTSDSLTPEQIEGIERFWRGYLERCGATVRFFGASLARFPI